MSQKLLRCVCSGNYRVGFWLGFAAIDLVLVALALAYLAEGWASGEVRGATASVSSPGQSVQEVKTAIGPDGEVEEDATGVAHGEAREPGALIPTRPKQPLQPAPPVVLPGPPGMPNDERALPMGPRLREREIQRQLVESLTSQAS